MVKSCRIEIKIDAEALMDAARGWTETALQGIADEAIYAAQYNVTPGLGPGPHPHPGRIDTGNLLENTVVLEDPQWIDSLHAFIAWGNNDMAYYGLFLEVGWTSSAGNFFRYPWLWPGALRAFGFIAQILKSAGEVEA